jgi:hypothetical protein
MGDGTQQGGPWEVLPDGHNFRGHHLPWLSGAWRACELFPRAPAFPREQK